MNRILLILSILCLTTHFATAQNNVGVGTVSPDPSSALDVSATDTGPAGATGLPGPAGATGATGFGQGDGFVHYIGELYQGGIIVSVWKEAGVEHGLIASLVDIDTAAAWSNIINVAIGAPARNYYDGQPNTIAIIAQAGHINSAAKLCDDYMNIDSGTGVYSDWYLPAYFELRACESARFIVNTLLGNSDGFRSNNYWSSTEWYVFNAHFWSFIPVGTANDNKYSLYPVRAVRRF